MSDKLFNPCNESKINTVYMLCSKKYGPGYVASKNDSKKKKKKKKEAHKKNKPVKQGLRAPIHVKMPSILKSVCY